MNLDELCTGCSTWRALCVPARPEHIREFQRRKAKFRAMGGLCLVVAAGGFLAAAGIGTVDSNSSGAAWFAMIISAIALDWREARE